MTSANPYYDPDADSDVFHPQTDKGSISGHTDRHVLDGTKCHCGSHHNLSLPPNVPEEILDKVSEYIDKLPDKTIEIIVCADSSLSLKLIHDFVEFAEEIDKANSYGPILRAFAEAIESVNGKGTLGPQIKFYQAEQRVISTHVLLKKINNLKQSMDADQRDHDHDANDPVYKTLDSVVESVLQRLQIAIEAYRKAGAETKNTIDDNVVEVGRFNAEDAPYFATRLIEIPILKPARLDDEEEEKEKENDSSAKTHVLITGDDPDPDYGQQQHI